jgi:hypothetical protein
MHLNKNATDAGLIRRSSKIREFLAAGDPGRFPIPFEAPIPLQFHPDPKGLQAPRYVAVIIQGSFEGSSILVQFLKFQKMFLSPSFQD